MKVVSALAAVRHLLDTGRVRPGDTLLDSSSGIYAHALALACHRYGLRCHIVGSTTVDDTLRAQLAVLGAHLEQMPSSASLTLDQNRRVARIHEILRDNPGHHWMRQYHDDIHCLGYRAVADRIAGELGNGPLTLVGGVGSGASTGALATYLVADTGHRYADTVFARHRDAPPIDTLAPTPVSTVDDLAHPWSRMDWARAPAPNA